VDLVTWRDLPFQKIKGENPAARPKPESRVIIMNPTTSDAISVVENVAETPTVPRAIKEEITWSPNGWRFWAIFPGLCLSMLLTGPEISILATSLPTIVADLHGGPLYVWAMNGYCLTTVADIFGRRIPMIMALVIFGLGSGLYGGANSLEMLIAARLGQGIGGGSLFVMIDTITADLAPLREWMKYMAITMTFFTLGSFMGSIVGEVIVERASWMRVFYINSVSHRSCTTFCGTLPGRGTQARGNYASENC
jgi:MFS family permease